MPRTFRSSGCPRRAHKLRRGSSPSPMVKRGRQFFLVSDKNRGNQQIFGSGIRCALIDIELLLALRSAAAIANAVFPIPGGPTIRGDKGKSCSSTTNQQASTCLKTSSCPIHCSGDSLGLPN